MKVTIDLSTAQVKEIIHMTGKRSTGLAVRKLVLDVLQMNRRGQIAGKFISGRWGGDLSGFEAGRLSDRSVARKRAGKLKG